MAETQNPYQLSENYVARGMDALGLLPHFTPPSASASQAGGRPDLEKYQWSNYKQATGFDAPGLDYEKRAELWNYYRNTIVPYVARQYNEDPDRERMNFDQFFAHERPKAPTRTWGEALVPDTLGAPVIAAAHGVAAIADLVAGPENDTSNWINRQAGWIEENQSDVVKDDRARLAREIAEDEAQGGSGIVPVLKGVYRSPVQTLGTAVGGLAPAAVVGMVSGPAAAVTVPAVLGAQGAGQVRGSIYEKLKATPHDVLMQKSPPYAELINTGMSEHDAKLELAGIARNWPEIFGAGLLNAVTARIAPVERGLAGLTTTLRRPAVAGLEAATNAVQNAGTQIATNAAVQSVLPDQSLTEGVAREAASGAVMGGMLGGAIGARRPPHIEGARPDAESGQLAAPTEGETLALPAPDGAQPALGHQSFQMGDAAHYATPDDIATVLNNVPRHASRDAVRRNLESAVEHGTLEELAVQQNLHGRAARQLLALMQERAKPRELPAPDERLALPSPDDAMPGGDMLSGNDGSIRRQTYREAADTEAVRRAADELGLTEDVRNAMEARARSQAEPAREAEQQGALETGDVLPGQEGRGELGGDRLASGQSGDGDAARIPVAESEIAGRDAALRADAPPETRSPQDAAPTEAPPSEGLPVSGEPEQGALFSRSAMKSVDANVRRGRVAMNRALLERRDVNRAMHRSDLGWVDFVWGDDKKGIQHIVKQRMVEDGKTEAEAKRMLVDQLVDVVARGQTARRAEIPTATRLVVEHNGHRALLLRRKGGNGWMITGYELRDKSKQEPPGGQGGLGDPSKPTQTVPIRSRHDLGAGDEASVAKTPSDGRGAGFDASKPTQTAPTLARRSLGADGDFTVSDSARADHPSGRRAADLNTRLRERMREWRDADNVEVVQSIDDLPARVREQIKEEGAYNAEGTTFDGKAYVVADNVSSLARAVEVARHELIGHYGLEQMVGPARMADVARKVMTAERLGNKRFRELGAEVDRRQPGLSPERRAREIVAMMAERNLDSSITRRVIDAVRTFLKKVGLIKGDVSDAEIAGMLRDARRYLDGKVKGREGSPDATPAFSRAGKRPQDFVLRNGEKDWGVLPAIVQQRLGFKKPSDIPIRLKFGEHYAKNRGFGAVHIEASHASELRELGMTAEQYVDALLKQVVGAYDLGNGRLMLRAKGVPRGSVFVELARVGDHYSVVTAYDSPRDEGRLIWSGRPRMTAQNERGTSSAQAETTTTRSSADRSAMGNSLSDDGLSRGENGVSRLNPLPDSRIADQTSDSSVFPKDTKGKAEPDGGASFSRPAQPRSPNIPRAEREPSVVERLRSFVRHPESAKDAAKTLLSEGGKAPQPEWLADQVTKWADHLNPVEQVVRRTGNTELGRHLMGTLRLFGAAAQHQIHRMETSHVEPMLHTLAKAWETRFKDLPWYKETGYDQFLRDFGTVGNLIKHGRERNAEILRKTQGEDKAGSGRTNEEIAAIEREIRQEAPGLVELYEQVYKDHLKPILDLRDQTLRDAGLLTPEMEAERPRYDWYVPLYGDPDAARSVEDGFSRQTGASLKAPKAKEAMGRDGTLADNPLQNVLESATAAIKQAGAQQWKRDFVSFVEGTKGAKVLLSAKVHRVDAPTIFEKYVSPKDGFVHERVKPNPMMSPDALVLRDGNQTVVVHIGNKKVLEALQGVQQAQLDGVFGTMGKATRLLAGIYTRYNPIFPMTNKLRDSQQQISLLMADAPIADRATAARRALAYNAKFTADWRMKEGGEYAKWTERYRELGGETHYADLFRDDTMKNLQHEFAKLTGATTKHKAMAAAEKVGDFIDRINEHMELSSRVALFKSLVESGMGEREAALYTKNTMNFETKGKLGRQLGALFTFAPTAIFDAHRMLQSMRSLRGATVMAAHLGLMYALYGAMKSMGGDDEDGIAKLNKVPLSQTGRFLTLLDPSDPDGKGWKFPVGFGYGRIALTTAAALHRFMDGIDDRGTFITNIAQEALASNFSPIEPVDVSPMKDFAGWTMQTFTPTVIRPLMQLAANQTAQGSPIHKPDEWTGSKLRSTQSWPMTPSLFKNAAKWIYENTGVDVYPETLQHTLRSYAGNGAMDVVRAFQVLGGEKVGTDLTLNDLPGLQTFGSRVFNHDMVQYRQSLSDLQHLKATRDYEYEQGRGADFDDEHPGVMQALEMFKESEKQIKALTKERKSALALEDNAERQRQALELNRAMRQVMLRANKAYREMQTQ